MSRILSTALLALACASPAQADPQPVSYVVRHSDLDLRTPEGIRRLQRRVDRAVQWVCRVPKPLSPMLARFQRECKEVAARQAQPQMARVIQRAQQQVQFASTLSGTTH